VRLYLPGSIEGRLSPGNVGVEVRASEKTQLGYGNGGGQREYRIDSLVPGNYKVRATAKGYAPGSYDLQVSEGKTARLDIAMLPESIISGRVTSSLEITDGYVMALDTKERQSIGMDTIGADGTYMIGQLPAGTYDLIVFALKHERQIGLGYLPSPDTLKPGENQAIRDLYAKLDSAVAKKDIDTLMSCYSKSHVDSDTGKSDYQELRTVFLGIFAKVDSWTDTRTIDMVVGQTGKSAVIVSHLDAVMKWTPKHGEKARPAANPRNNETQDVLSYLVFENGSWKIAGNGLSPERCSGCDDYGGVIVNTLPGEPRVKWRYTNNPAIAGIKVSVGMESKGHDVVLTPLK
jgi:ketosteroid isomerase-like protein